MECLKGLSPASRALSMEKRGSPGYARGYLLPPLRGSLTLIP